ncbi:acylneuraminate cytidylyltransferase family protein [Pseudoalteromonas sp. JBTF-M23]|uniref:Acylneuraminate cytidylyltransferase family protein n=1 Tax=Pseudoalteromonas caenipelagi TaxID=2726988 RepID=A0A849VF26_9GAMM|nr:acylneuraminate cytidylyltransferase family protein [Pseudoalteromonas caenipelagi]NOU51765.1 acylneuraminate cytidylyltransferase family protein [Pseudoalteromonas caenipelagi]
MNIAIIPARSGSKGFRDKNIARLNGKTLIEYAIASAMSAKKIERVVISTDSASYEKIAVDAGAESFGLRSKSLSGDNSKTVDVVTNLLCQEQFANVENIVLLQPTSPLRTGKEIDECLSIANMTGESVVSVARVDDPHPFKMKKIVNGALQAFIDGTTSEVNRQSLQEAYALTGAIYVTKKEHLLNEKSFFSNKTVPYVVERFVNIDSEEDFEYLKFLVERNKVRLPL